MQHDEEGRPDNFIFLNDIQYKKQNILKTNPEFEEDYSPLFINLGLSQALDTIFPAQEMNARWLVLDKKMQYDYLFYTVKRSANRKGKWAKKDKEKEEVVKLVQQYFECSPTKAKEYLKILNNQQLDEIRSELTIGGPIKNNKKE